jgi:hypothetical protein
MYRRTPVAFAGLLAAGAAMTAGCASTFMAAGPHDAASSGPLSDPTFRVGPALAASATGQSGEPCRAFEAAPVADLSGVDLGLPRRFFGLGYGLVYPYDSTLVSSAVYDLSVAYDVSSFLTAELTLGVWDLGDRPIAGADSVFAMRPALVLFQFAKEIPTSKMRAYLGYGGGYAQNSYDLGPYHESYFENSLQTSDYDVRADDASLQQCVVGVEKYSTADARLNFAVEGRYVWGTLERHEYADGNPLRSDSVELRLYLIRVCVTKRF